MASIKELAKRESRFVSGHRLCAGCGAGIIMRHVLLAIDKPVIATCATGCVEVASTIFPYSSWKIPWIHSAFENSAATISGIESTYKVFRREGKIDKDIVFVAFGGDGGTYDIGLQALSGAAERGHNVLYVCYNNEAYMNCLSISSLVLTKNGIKNIKDIKVGDLVYAFDQNKRELVVKKCSGVFDNGIKPVYELQTLHYSIKATPNHPFLVLKRNGKGKRNTFVWKQLSEIKIGDEIVVCKNINPGKSFKFSFQKVNKGDYKVNKINEVNIPEYSNTDLMKYLGIYVGDGWVRSEKGEVGFALPKRSKEREILIKLHKKIFGGKIREDNMYVYINSVNLARFIESLGFNKGAKNKTIPPWIFTLPVEERESFIEGLILSDGYKIGNSYRYVSASEELLKNLKMLLLITGYKVGKIHWQKKEKGTKCANRELLNDSKYGYICFSKRKNCNLKKYLNQYKSWDFLIDNKFFSTEKVKSIKYLLDEPVIDLRIEDQHNFIANGIVVHNTGIQRSGATPKYAYTTTSPVGKVIPGKLQWKKNLPEIMVAHGIPYVATAIPGRWNDLVSKVEKAVKINGFKFIEVLSPCRLGWSHEPELTMEISRIAVETCIWPLYEVIEGKYRLTYKPKEKKPVSEWFKLQGRFRHLLLPENAPLLEEIQKEVDRRWEELLKKCET
jgi:pyruvate/2-oxoacid:ferredoxin oxidoreductase beta subunit/intein/homing endonuclease